MDIFIKKEIDKNFTKMTHKSVQDFPKESYLEETVAKNLERFPDGMSNGNFIVLGKQIETGHGPLDILATDGNGSIFIIETKLNRNHSDRRLIIAQIFDYAAGMWSKYKKFEDFEKVVKEKNNNLTIENLIKNSKSLSELSQDNEEIKSIIEKIKSNLENGIFKFITVWDERDESLDNTVNYINQKLDTKIYVITMKYFKDNDLELYIPEVYGLESEKISTTKNQGLKGAWPDEKSLCSKFKTEFGTNEYANFEKLVKFVENNGGWVKYGRGNRTASINCVFKKFKKSSNSSLFSLFSNGKLTINFNWTKSELRDPIANRLETELGIEITESQRNDNMTLSRAEWADNTDKIIKVIKEFL